MSALFTVRVVGKPNVDYTVRFLREDRAEAFAAFKRDRGFTTSITRSGSAPPGRAGQGRVTRRNVEVRS